jgi:hypothetical protein
MFSPRPSFFGQLMSLLAESSRYNTHEKETVDNSFCSLGCPCKSEKVLLGKPPTPPIALIDQTQTLTSFPLSIPVRRKNAFTRPVGLCQHTVASTEATDKRKGSAHLNGELPQGEVRRPLLGLGELS